MSILFVSKKFEPPQEIVKVGWQRLARVVGLDEKSFCSSFLYLEHILKQAGSRIKVSLQELKHLTYYKKNIITINKIIMQTIEICKGLTHKKVLIQAFMNNVLSKNAFPIQPNKTKIDEPIIVNKLSLRVCDNAIKNFSRFYVNSSKLS